MNNFVKEMFCALCCILEEFFWPLSLHVVTIVSPHRSICLLTTCTHWSSLVSMFRGTYFSHLIKLQGTCFVLLHTRNFHLSPDIITRNLLLSPAHHNSRICHLPLDLDCYSRNSWHKLCNSPETSSFK